MKRMVFVLIASMVVCGLSATAVAEQEVEPPELLYEVEAEYTDEAIEAGIEGGVILEIEIGSDGSVSNVEVIDGLGYGLDESAKEAVEQFEFRPAMVDGEPIAVVLDFTVRFSMPILPAAFEGRIIDPETEQGIADARVTIRYTGDDYDPVPEATTTTDSDGNFDFDGAPPGHYDVELRLDQYRDYETDIELIAGETVEVEYSVRAEDENFVGSIREAGTRDRLSAMRLTLLDAETQQQVREEFSESGGRFGFKAVEPGQYLLRVEGTDYTTASFEIEIVEGEVTSGNFYIRAEDEGFRVRTTERRERSDVDRQTIGLEEVRRMPGAATDVVRVIENLPGVARPSFIGGQPVVRGSAPEDTSIFLEGDNIPIAFHFLGGPAVVSTEMIESVDFYPGNFSPRFGRATAGIIDLQTRSPKDDRFHGFAEADLLDASAIVEGPIGDRWSFAFSGRRSYYDVFLPTVLDAIDAGAQFSPRYYDYQGWSTYRSEDGDHKVEFFLYGSDDQLDVRLPDDEPQGDTQVQTTGANFGNSFHRGQFRWEWTPEGLPIDTTLMTSFGRNQVALEVAENLFFDLNFYTSQSRYDTRMELTDNLDLRAGLDAEVGNVGYKYSLPESESTPDGGGINIAAEALSDDRSTWRVLPAVYTELDYKIFDRWRLIPGLRVDYYGDVGQTSVSPRFSTRFSITDEVTAKGGIGLFTQPPVPGQTEEDFGNPNLTFEKAMHYAIGAEWQPMEYLEVDTTLFFRDNYDLVSPTSAETVDDEGQRRPLIFDNAGEGRAYGWELLLRHYPRDKFFGWLSYTLSRSERLERESGEWVPFDFDQTHILTLVAGYSLPWSLDVSARFRLVTGNPQTPVVGAAFDADDDTYRQRRGERNSVRAAPFHQLDLRVDRRFVFDAWTLSTYLDITNVYNATNEEGRQYNYDYSESEPIPGLPFLPTIGVSARF